MRSFVGIRGLNASSRLPRDRECSAKNKKPHQGAVFLHGLQALHCKQRITWQRRQQQRRRWPWQRRQREQQRQRREQQQELQQRVREQQQELQRRERVQQVRELQQQVRERELLLPSCRKRPKLQQRSR